jgi:hypothetical protein
MIVPKLTPLQNKRFRELNPHLDARWNRRFARWEIWWDDKIKRPYIVATADVIDARIYDEIRHALWFSQRIRKNIYRMHETGKKIREKKLRDEEDVHLQLGKEVAPLLRTMKDAGTSSHGRSKTRFPGVEFGGLK